MASPNFNREDVLRALGILYPQEHGLIELVVIGKGGQLRSCRSANHEQLVDEIARYDGQEDIAAIYTTLNRLESATFEGRKLTVDKPLSPGPRVNSSNVARVTGILFDIDPFRTNGDKKDSTTESEHRMAIKAADFLKHKLAFMGWPEPIVGDSGNGTALRYLCDLPATKETEDILSRVLKAANAMLPGELAEQVEVDPAVFDRPRISKVFGTMARKGPGTDERPHRRATIISAPEKLEPVKIDCIINLASMGRKQEDGPKGETADKAEPLSEDAVERLQALFTAEPGFKAKLFDPAAPGNRSTRECYLCSRLWEAGFDRAEIHNIMDIGQQSKWHERDETYRRSTIEAGIAKAEASHKERAEREAAKMDEPIRLEDVADIGYDKDGKVKNARLSPTFAARAVLERMQLAMSEGSEDIYRFNGQVYKPDGARIIDQVLCDAAADLNTTYQLKETLRRVRNTLLNHPVAFDPSPYLLGVKNGVVDLTTGEFREYSPDDLITDQIQVQYDPAAKCPRFVQFLEEVCPNPIDRLMLVDWYTIHAIRSMFPYVMFLNGLGRNGKGIYERVMQRFYGEHSFSHMPLEELTVKNNRFAGADLAGKRGQIVAEAGESHAKGKRTIPTAFLKNATGDGIIDSDQKNKGRIKFKPFYKSTIDANDMPRIEDTSRGWIERFCKADMPYPYVDNPLPGTIERKKDPALFERLTTESELSGILNLIIYRAPEIIRTKTITKRSGAEMFAEYQRQSSSITTFLETFCDYKPVSDRSKDIFLDFIFEKYEEWCDRTVADKVDAIRFGKAVKTFCQGKEPERVRDEDKKRKIYHGLSFDANRYQAHWDYYRTNKGPLKTATAPLGPLNEEKTWPYIREKFGHEIESGWNTPHFSVNGDDSDCKNSNGADNGFNGPRVQSNGADNDLSAGHNKETAAAHDCGEELPTQGATQTPSLELRCAKCGADLTGCSTVESGGKLFCAQPGCGYPPRGEAGA